MARTTTEADEDQAVEERADAPEDEPESEPESEHVSESEPEPEPEPESEHVSEPENEDEPRLRRTADPVLMVAVALVTLAAACAAYFGWSWYTAAHDDSLAFSKDRDAVLRAGEQGVQNMNTLDYRTVDADLANWENSSTGDLHDELVTGRAQFAAQVRQAHTVTTAKIIDGAVTELDARAGKAGVIVAVQITVTPQSGAATTKQSRMRAQLTRTGGAWKLSALGQAPVGSTR